MVTRVDVSKAVEVNTWIASIVEKYGRLDAAANCAAIIGKHHGIRAITDQDDDEWDRIMNVNLKGVMFCLRAELRVIKDGGSIVNVASILGTMGTFIMSILHFASLPFSSFISNSEHFIEF